MTLFPDMTYSALDLGCLWVEFLRFSFSDESMGAGPD